MLRCKDHLSPKVQDWPGPYSKTPSQTTRIAGAQQEGEVKYGNVLKSKELYILELIINGYYSIKMINIA
jgi:hypothetical protein